MPIKIRFIPPLFFLSGMCFFLCIFWLQGFFLLWRLSWQCIISEIRFFWNIKINRVIIPLKTILHGYRDSEEFSREQRLYRPNHKNCLNWRALLPAPLLGGGFAPHPLLRVRICLRTPFLIRFLSESREDSAVSANLALVKAVSFPVFGAAKSGQKASSDQSSTAASSSSASRGRGRGSSGDQTRKGSSSPGSSIFQDRRRKASSPSRRGAKSPCRSYAKPSRGRGFRK